MRSVDWRYGGGREKCRTLCKNKRRSRARAGEKWEKEECVLRFELESIRGGDCLHPQPMLLPMNRRIWRLWDAAGRYVVINEMAGRILYVDPVRVEAEARTLGVPWNAETRNKFRMIEEKWLEKLAREHPPPRGSGSDAG